MRIVSILGIYTTRPANPTHHLPNQPSQKPCRGRRHRPSPRPSSSSVGRGSWRRRRSPAGITHIPKITRSTPIATNRSCVSFKGGILMRLGIRMRLRDDGENLGGTTTSVRSSGTHAPSATARDRSCGSGSQVPYGARHRSVRRCSQSADHRPSGSLSARPSTGPPAGTSRHPGGPDRSCAANCSWQHRRSNKQSPQQFPLE